MTVQVGQWTRAERVRLSGIVATVVALSVTGWSLCLYHTQSRTAASALVWRFGGFARRYRA